MRNKLFGVPNIEKQITIRHITFTGKVARKSDDHLITKLFALRCNQNILRRGVLHTNNTSIVHNLHLIIPEVGKTGALKTCAHFSLDEKYWQHLISGIGNSSASIPPALIFLQEAHSPNLTPPLTANPHHLHQTHQQGQGQHHKQLHRLVHHQAPHG